MTVNALHVQTPWLWEGNVFSHVCHSVCPQRRGVPMWPLPMMLWTSLHRVPLTLALVKIYFFCPVGHQTWDLLPQPHPSVTDIWWPPLEICSNLFTWDPHLLRSDVWWWPLKHIWFSSGQYVSFWNAFLGFYRPQGKVMFSEVSVSLSIILFTGGVVCLYGGSCLRGVCLQWGSAAYWGSAQLPVLTSSGGHCSGRYSSY